MNVASAPQVFIRPASEQDIPLILSFIRKHAEFVKSGAEVTATLDGLQESLFGNNKVAEAVIACAGQTPAGYAVFFNNFSTFQGRPGIYLEDIFVDPEYRRHGVGKALLGYLENVARERGCSQLLWSVLKWNQRAIDFYEALGAQPLEDWSVYRLTIE